MRSVFGGLASLVTNQAPSYSANTGRGGRLNLRRNSSAGTLEQYGAVSTLFSIVQLLAETTASVEWKLFRTQDGRGRISGEETRREVTSHLALDVWNKPNDHMTGFEFREMVQQHLDLTGEGWSTVARDPRAPFPMELWPVRPDRMEVVPSAEDFIAGYKYHGPDGEDVPFETNEILRLKYPNPSDFYRGMGPVQSLLHHLDSIRYSAEWNRNFFLNSAEPGGVIEVADGLSDPQFKKMLKRWNEQHHGMSKAHRVAIIEHGKWVDRSYSQKDMQFVELQDVGRDVIREAFRIHKHMQGISDDVNRANAEAADYTFAKYLIVNRLKRWREMLNTRFLPMFGDTARGVEFDYVNPVPEDEIAEAAELTSKVDAYTKLLAQGVDPIAAAETCGLPLMPVNSKVVEAPTPDPIQALATRLDELLKIGG